MNKSNLPKIAIVGRPNVGKSTLFNRLIGQRQAIVDDIPGVTRDRQYGQSEWEGYPFTLIDTGGFVPTGEPHELAYEIRDQVYLALEESDGVLFVTDGREGLTPTEEEIARLLRRHKTPIVMAVNKLDTDRQDPLVHEFRKLGFPQCIGISGESSRGISDMLDALRPVIQVDSKHSVQEHDVKLAIVGQPNVGKSTLVNALLGENRAVVHHEAGTTLDPLNIHFERNGLKYEIVDTAGIRRKRQTEGKIQKVGVIKALQAVGRADLVLVMMDALKGMAAQDAKILGKAQEKGRGIILVLNKWDQVPPGSRIKDFEKPIRERFVRQENFPLIAISAKSGRGVPNLFELIEKTFGNFQRRIGTGELNRVFQTASQKHPHPTHSGKSIHLNYITQSNSAPPRFVIFCNHPKLVKEDYLRYLERTFRKSFDFTGVPIVWKLRLKK